MRQPLGVVVILIPCNFPADEILLLALPALASGNVVIVKPAEVAVRTKTMWQSTTKIFVWMKTTMSLLGRLSLV